MEVVLVSLVFLQTLRTSLKNVRMYYAIWVMIYTYMTSATLAQAHTTRERREGE